MTKMVKIEKIDQNGPKQQIFPKWSKIANMD